MLENVEVKRLNNLDILKAICAFLVICIHISYKGKIENIIMPLCRIAVPIFFMITGYFYHKTSKKPLKQIKKIFLLIVLSNLLYIIINTIINGNMTVPNKEEIKNSFLYNSSPFSFQLWYLNALLYVLIIAYLSDKLKIRKYLYYFIPFLLLTNIVYGEYSIVVLNKDFDPIYMRNFLFMGLPFFLLGDLVYKNEDKLKEKLSTGKLSIMILIFAATTIVEEYMLDEIKKNAIGDLYISTIFLAVAIFIYAIKIRQVDIKNKLAIIGRKYSTYIFVIHVMFITLFNKYIVSNNILNNVIQIIIFFASLLVAMSYVKIKSLIMIGWKKYNSVSDAVKLITTREQSE